MFTSSLVTLALIAAPNVDFDGGVSTTVAGGTSPVQPGVDTGSSQTVSVEVIPSVGLRIGDEGLVFGLSYSPRLFYRTFLGDIEIDALNEPLVLHRVAMNYDHTLSRIWSVSLTSELAVGEVDFQVAPGTIGGAFNPTTGDTPGGVTGSPTDETGGALGQAPAAQALSSLTVSGAFSLTGRLTRQVVWVNDVQLSYNRPIGDSETQEDEDGNQVAVIGQLPESVNVTYTTGIDYILDQKNTLELRTSYTANFFEALAELDTSTTAVNRSQTFHSVSVTAGYSYDFARDSTFNASAGFQLAFGQADFVGSGEAEEASTDVIPLPTASLGLSWVPVNQRDFTVSNNLTVGVLGTVDPFLGTFQPRLTSGLGFQLGFPPRLSVGLRGSFAMPLAAPEVGQGVTFARQFAAGDSQVNVTLPVDYQFSESVSAGVGGRLVYLFTRFGVPTDPSVEDPGSEVGDSIIFEVYATLSFTLSTLR